MSKSKKNKRNKRSKVVNKVKQKNGEKKTTNDMVSKNSNQRLLVMYEFGSNFKITFGHEIKREEVENGDINATLSTLNQLLTPSYILAARNNLFIIFLGYDDDSRELFEIPECREFMRKLDTHWSLWLYFLSSSNATDVILPLLLDTHPKRIDKNTIKHNYHPHDILHYLYKINYLADNRLITENELRDVWKQTMLGMGMKVNF